MGPPGTWSWEKLIQPGPLGKDVWYNEHRSKLEKQQKRQAGEEAEEADDFSDTEVQIEDDSHGGSYTEFIVDSESDSADHSAFEGNDSDVIDGDGRDVIDDLGERDEDPDDSDSDYSNCESDDAEVISDDDFIGACSNSL